MQNAGVSLLIAGFAFDFKAPAWLGHAICLHSDAAFHIVQLLPQSWSTDHIPHLQLLK
jgi:hypothetical protein